MTASPTWSSAPGTSAVVPAPGAANPRGIVEAYLTTPNQRNLLTDQPPIPLSAGEGSAATVTVDATQHFQVMDGFGASLTDSSASVLAALTPAARVAVFTKLFDPVRGAGLSFLRQPMGASDFATTAYSYDDVASSQTDPTLAQFSIAHDQRQILPQLIQIRGINSNLMVMGTPWSPPAWMKSGDSLNGSDGGTLQPQYYDAYAQYFVKFIQAYAAAGIPIAAVTVQNEPDNAASGYPGMALSVAEEAAFVPHLSAALSAAGLVTKIIGFDHNWDLASYATALLGDPTANAALDGTAFHCYAGDVSAQSTVHSAYPRKNIYLTECSGGDWSPDFAANLAWDTHNLVIGATRNWAKTVATWNLALDQTAGPRIGGCSNCRGVITVNTSTGAVTYNVEYYVLGQIAKVVVPGAIRIASTSDPNGIETVAFLDPDGSYALIAHNQTSTRAHLVVNQGGRRFATTLPAGAVESFRWA